MPLTEIAIKALKPGDKITRHYDEAGLYLEVSPAGGRWWRYKYRFDGKEKRLSLGTYPEVTLKQARQKRDELRQQISTNIDPGLARKQTKVTAAGGQGHTFENVARKWWDRWRLANSPRHAGYVIRRLETDVFPAIGQLPINSITAKTVVACVRGIEARGVSDLAHRQLNKINQVFRFAIVNDFAERNPAADIKPSDILLPVRSKNMARIDVKELPRLLVAIDEYDGKPITRLALQLMCHTFVRTSELIEGRWSELDGDYWRIPAERMKLPSPHIVPLSQQAKQILADLHKITGAGEYFFPGERRGAMSNNTILFALYRMGYRSRMTGHGFRGLASTVLHEQGWPHEHIELQLAHMPRDEVSAAYNHALYLKQRGEMMQAWSDFIDCQRDFVFD